MESYSLHAAADTGLWSAEQTSAVSFDQICTIRAQILGKCGGLYVLDSYLGLWIRNWIPSWLPLVTSISSAVVKMRVNWEMETYPKYCKTHGWSLFSCSSFTETSVCSFSASFLISWCSETTYMCRHMCISAWSLLLGPGSPVSGPSLHKVWMPGSEGSASCWLAGYQSYYCTFDGVSPTESAFFTWPDLMRPFQRLDSSSS